MSLYCCKTNRRPRPKFWTNYFMVFVQNSYTIVYIILISYATKIPSTVRWVSTQLRKFINPPLRSIIGTVLFGRTASTFLCLSFFTSFIWKIISFTLSLNNTHSKKQFSLLNCWLANFNWDSTYHGWWSGFVEDDDRASYSCSGSTVLNAPLQYSFLSYQDSR